MTAQDIEQKVTKSLHVLAPSELERSETGPGVSGLEEGKKNGTPKYVVNMWLIWIKNMVDIL